MRKSENMEKTDKTDKTESMSQAKNISQDEISKIDKFLTRQRREILEKLYQHKKLSHKELAEVIKSTPTSLWNICRIFDQFIPQLLISEVSGRYKYYSLTETARQYMMIMSKNAPKEKNQGSSSTEEKNEVLKAQVIAGVEKIRRNCNEEWEVVLDNYFVSFLKHSLFTIDKTVVEAIEQMLGALKQLIQEDEQKCYDECMEKCFRNPILQVRLNEYLESFYSLGELYRLMDDEMRVWDVYRLLDDTLGYESKKTTEACREIDSCKENGESGYDETYERIKRTLLWLVQREQGKNMQEIYEDIRGIIKGSPNKMMTVAEKVANYGKKDR